MDQGCFRQQFSCATSLPQQPLAARCSNIMRSRHCSTVRYSAISTQIWGLHIDKSELGHGIHDLLSRTKYTRFHAWRAPPDFAEALSTMLENWTWMSEELKEMSCHYTKLGPDFMDRPPAERIPDELLERLVKSRSLFRAQYILTQM